MKKKWIGADPSTGIKRTKIGEVRSWTDDEIRQYENRWPIGTKQRTAFALMLYTGQRRSDVHRMTWQDISHKTGRIKVHPAKDRHEDTGAAASGLARSAGEGAAQSRHHRQHRVRQAVHGGRLLVLHARCHQSRRAAARLSAARTAQGRRSPLGGSRMHARSRSWRCLVTSRLRKRSDTRRTPIKSGWRRTRCRGWKRKPRTKFAQTARSSLGKCRKHQEIQCDRDPAGAP